MKKRTSLSLLVVVASALAIAVTVSAAAARGADATCKPAKIAGKSTCLKVGQRCTSKLDRRYHAYGFHCHAGRVTRATTPKQPTPPAPAPPPGPTTTGQPVLPEPPAPTGQLVDVGGYRLMLECVGTGSPTVVIEPGNTASRHVYRKIQYALGADTRVCTYDRPGTVTPLPSASDARPANVPSTSETFVRELHTLLTNANEPGPYVLVGSSFGGLLITAYTAHYPADVAGLAFMDAAGPASVEVTAVLIQEPWQPGADLDLIRGVNFGSRPVVVLATTLPDEAKDLQSRSTNVVGAVDPRYGHNVAQAAPGLVYEAIRIALAGARAGGGPLPKCAETPLPQIGARCTTP
jgi:pimeloyl-ACP methyl ester carboxylesterase